MKFSKYIKEKYLTEAMGKKQFIAIAKILKDNKKTGVNPTKEIGDRLIELFKSENPRFDEERFRKAAGL